MGLGRRFRGRRPAIAREPDCETWYEGHHHVAFQSRDKAFLLPPRRETVLESIKDVINRFTKQLQVEPVKTRADDLQFVTLNQQMREIVQRHFPEQDLIGLEMMSNFSPLRKIAYMTRIYFDSELFLVRPKPLPV